MPRANQNRSETNSAEYEHKDANTKFDFAASKLPEKTKRAICEIDILRQYQLHPERFQDNPLLPPKRFNDIPDLVGERMTSAVTSALRTEAIAFRLKEMTRVFLLSQMADGVSYAHSELKNSELRGAIKYGERADFTRVEREHRYKTIPAITSINDKEIEMRFGLHSLCWCTQFPFSDKAVKSFIKSLKEDFADLGFSKATISQKYTSSLDEPHVLIVKISKAK